MSTEELTFCTSFSSIRFLLRFPYSFSLFLKVDLSNIFDIFLPKTFNVSKIQKSDPRSPEKNQRRNGRARQNIQSIDFGVCTAMAYFCSYWSGVVRPTHAVRKDETKRGFEGESVGIRPRKSSRKRDCFRSRMARFWKSLESYVTLLQRL